MRKIDKRYIHMGIVLFVTVCLCIVFYFILFNGERLLTIASRFMNMFKPIIIGIFSAYIMNPVMMFFEGKILFPLFMKLSRKKNPQKISKIVRPISVFLTLSIFLISIFALIIMILPQVINSIENIIDRYPELKNTANFYINKFIEDHQGIADIVTRYRNNVENWFVSTMIPKIEGFVRYVSTNIKDGVITTISAVIDFIVGIIVAVYLLLKKELFCAQAKKMTYALLREERANNMINNMRFANKTFGGFLSGKLIDSIIIGIICFIVISIFRIPYAMLISVVVGVTNIIPYFGPFIGAIPSAIILFMISPVKCLTFVIIIIVLQQIDGNIIGPIILGDSTGLSSFWVIFAITLFGGLWGVFGMFIGVPVFAVIYATIRTFINQRLIKKELPSDTAFYMTQDFHTDDTTSNTGSEIKFVKKLFDHILVEGKDKKDPAIDSGINSDEEE